MRARCVGGAFAQNLFNSVWWLKPCERDFLEDLSVFIERESFASKELIPSSADTLNILAVLPAPLAHITPTREINESITRDGL